MSSEPTNESVATWSALTPLPAQVPPPLLPDPQGMLPPTGVPPLPAGVPPTWGCPLYPRGCPLLPAGVPPNLLFYSKVHLTWASRH